MPFQMKIQPLDAKAAARIDLAAAAKPAGKASRLKRLFERQFPSVLRISSAEKVVAAGGGGGADGKEKEDGDQEPNSVCLDRMVLSFIEEGNEKPVRCGRRRCNCFNGNCDDSSDDDDFDPPPIAGDAAAAEILKGLMPCVSREERNLLADVSRIVEKEKICKGKGNWSRVLSDGLCELGYDAAICRSRWEKTPSFPAGEYEYVDVLTPDGLRLLVDIEFRSEFEIARSTKAYRAALQSLPSIFVGTADRLQQIVAVASEAARLSLKKKDLHFPPWRKHEYMRSKWLAAPQRSAPAPSELPPAKPNQMEVESAESKEDELKLDMTESELKEDESKDSKGEGESEGGSGAAPSPVSAVILYGDDEDEDPIKEPVASGEPEVVPPWTPPAVKPKAAAQSRVVTGLTSVLKEKP